MANGHHDVIVIGAGSVGVPATWQLYTTLPSGLPPMSTKPVSPGASSTSSRRTLSCSPTVPHVTSTSSRAFQRPALKAMK